MGSSLFSSAAANLNVSLHNYGSIINIILIFYHYSFSNSRIKKFSHILIV